MTAISATASTTKETADPRAKSSEFLKIVTWRLPIIVAFAPPSRAGVTNSPSVGTNTKMTAAWTPARLSGSVTRRNVVQGPAPRSIDASSREVPSFSSDV